MKEEGVKNLNIVLKTDVQGSAEAIKDVLDKLSNEEVKIKVVASGVGGINESDVNLALASDGIIVGFNVRADATARRVAEREGVDLRYYSIIYKLADDIKAALTGMLAPKYEEQILGLAEVREVFRSSKLGSIAGCMVIENTVKRGNPVRVLRDNVVIYEGELSSLRRFKEDANEVRQGMECGISVKNYSDVKVGDQIEVYKNVLVKHTVV
jgi:translation initiation factor IF-2